jgi:hypothetical protein
VSIDRIAETGKGEKWLDQARIHARYEPDAAPAP